MNKFGKILLWLILAAVGIMVILAAAAGIEYYRVKRSGAKVTLVSGPARAEETPPVLGVKYRFKTVFRLPWGIRPLSLEASAPAGSQLCAEPSFKLLKRGWGGDWWEGTVELQCYRLGKIAEAPVQAAFSNRQTIELKLPALQVTAPKLNGNQLELADAVDVAKQQKSSRTLWLVIFLAVLAAAVIVLIVLHYRKRKQARIIPPWEKALSAIQSLLEQVRTGAAHPEKSIARLTDIVREYMEQRFHLRAERQTTAEFMADLERGSGNLSREHRDFLKNFLTAADMVKFARVSADRGLFEDAAGKAGELIRATAPHEDGKENKQ